MIWYPLIRTITLTLATRTIWLGRLTRASLVDTRSL
jgi:hypothetical protein